MGGLLTVLWHGPRDAERIVVACGGAMGGLLGPSGGLYQRLGETLADAGVGMLRVGYRKPNDLDRCTIDLCAAVDLALAERGAAGDHNGPLVRRSDRGSHRMRPR